MFAAEVAFPSGRGLLTHWAASVGAVRLLAAGVEEALLLSVEGHHLVVVEVVEAGIPLGVAAGVQVVLRNSCPVSLQALVAAAQLMCSYPLCPISLVLMKDSSLYVLR